MHQKRKSIPKTWPIPRKRTKYIVTQRSPHKKEFSLSLLVIIRDLLNLAKNSAEAKKIIGQGEIEINHKKVFDEKFGPGLLDIITIKKIQKSFIVTLTEKGKLSLKETKDTKLRASKVIGKKVLNKKQIQVNLMNGRNIITNEKINVGDSIAFDSDKKAIVKVLPLKKDAEVFITRGKWQGKFAKIQEIKKPFLEIKIDTKKTVIPTKNAIVIEEKW